MKKRLIILLACWWSFAGMGQSPELSLNMHQDRPDFSITLDFSLPVYGINNALKQEMKRQHFDDSYSSWFSDGPRETPYSVTIPTLGLDLFKRLKNDRGIGIRVAWQTGYTSGINDYHGKITFNHRQWRLMPYYRLLEFKDQVVDVGASVSSIAFEVELHGALADEYRQVLPALMAGWKADIVSGNQLVLRFLADVHLMLGTIHSKDYELDFEEPWEEDPDFEAFHLWVPEVSLGFALGIKR